MIELIGRSLFQWDIGRQVKIKTPETVSEVHFARLGDSEALVVEPKTVGGEIVAEIPNTHLQEARNITVFLVKDDVTIERYTFQVIKREKPADYVYTETQVRTVEQLAEKLDQDIQERMSTVAEEVRGMVKDGKDGEDGFSPIAKVEETEDGAKITVTDAKGTTEAVVKNGKDGEDGEDGNPLQFAIKPTTDPATSLHIQDSAKYRVLDVSMSGKTEQYTTTGKNVFDLSKVKTLNSAITGGKVEINDTGIKMKNVWAQEIVSNENVLQIFEPNTNYICTARVKVIDKPNVNIIHTINILYLYDNINAANCVDVIRNDDKDNFINGQIIELKWTFMTKDLSNVKLYAYCYYDSDAKKAVGELEITELMIRKADITDATYEPYTGGIPSPNTEFPQEIVHAGRYNEETGRYEVVQEVSNKNIFKPTIKATHQSTANLDGDKYVFVNTATSGVSIVRSELFTLKRGINYIFSLHDCINLERVLVWVDGDTTKPIGQFSKSYTFNYTPTENINVQLGIYMLDISTLGNTAECRIQVEEDTVATPYILHESQKVTLTSSRELTKWDRLVKKDGLYQWAFKSKKYVFNGSENWGDYTTYKGFFNKSVLKDNSNRREGYCNQLICDTNGFKGRDESGFFWLGVGGNAHMYVPNCVFYDESLEDKGHINWVNHLKEHPLEIWTYSDTAEYIPVSEEEQAMLESLETYYGVTNISNSEECMMQIQYVADTKLYIDNKFTALATQIV